MADNVTVDNGGLTDYPVAADEVSYSGDTALVQLTRIVGVTGSEGSKTVLELLRAEDSAHTDGELGIPLLGVRNHAGAGADGDYSVMAMDSRGSVRTVGHNDVRRLSVTSSGITIATTAYTAGDQVGPIFELTNAARVSGGSGLITGVNLFDESGIIGAYDVVFFRETATLAADNAAASLAIAEMLKVAAVVQLPGAIAIGTPRVASAGNLAIPYECTGTSLFVGLICRFAHSFFSVGGADSLTLHVYVERD
jgi:hypothetical protein